MGHRTLPAGRINSYQDNQEFREGPRRTPVGPDPTETLHPPLDLRKHIGKAGAAVIPGLATKKRSLAALARVVRGGGTGPPHSTPAAVA